MDIEMPIMNGIETTKYISNYNKEILIFGITGHDDISDHATYRKLAMTDVLTKPINLKELTKKLNSHINLILTLASSNGVYDMDDKID